MQPDEFNKQIKLFDEQIKHLQNEKEKFILQNREDVLQVIEERKNKNRKWFVANFDKIWQHKKLFSLGTNNASITIDFWRVYLFQRCGCGFTIKHISFGRLIKLWEMGFMYKGYPIVEYIDATTKQSIKYIKNNQLCTQDICSNLFPKSVMKLLDYKNNANYNKFADYKAFNKIQGIINEKY